MRKTICASMLAAAAATFTLGSEARAQSWGLHSGDTVPSGNNMIYGEVGWPSLGIGFQHGMSDKVDLGVRFDFIYGYEYRTWTVLGMGLKVPIRISPVKNAKYSFQFHIDPGIKFDSFGCGGFGFGRFGGFGFGGFGRNCLLFGLQFPIGIEFGLHITREATISFGMDIPFYLNLTNGVYGGIPILFGFGFEYKVDDRIAIGLNTRFGPSIVAANGGSDAWFGFVTQAFFAYRL